MRIPGKTLVALSGGADSVALLRMLADERQDIEALHCNFHLRGEESDRDERFCRQLCGQLGVPLHVEHFDTERYARENGISIEMAARQLRYRWFKQMRERLGARQIAVAHHRDDQAETVLLNLLRGTGLRGLAGMHSRSGEIVRPLLDYSKADILRYLDSIGQPYVTDSTNLEPCTLRNRLRLEVLPLLNELNPQASLHLAQTARRVAEALPYYLRGIEVSDQLTADTLHERLLGLGFTAAQEADILRTTRSGALFESPTHRLVRHRGDIYIEPKNLPDEAPSFSTSIIAPKTEVSPSHDWPKDECRLDADLVPQPFTIRHPRPGDRFRPLGMKHGTRLVSDFLSDNGLNLLQKHRQWLLVGPSDEIIWVIGLRPDHRYRITATTKRVLVIRKY